MKRKTLGEISPEGMGRFLVKKGIAGRQISQLLDFSKDDEQVRRFTSDAERFRDRKSFLDWQKKGRLIYVLTDRKENLWGIIWFGKKLLPLQEFPRSTNTADYETTFAIRIYGKARGRGLARIFMKMAFDHFLDSFPKTRGIWLETFSDNFAAIRTYEGFGFLVASPAKENGKFLMTLKIS